MTNKEFCRKVTRAAARMRRKVSAQAMAPIRAKLKAGRCSDAALDLIAATPFRAKVRFEGARRRRRRRR